MQLIPIVVSVAAFALSVISFGVGIRTRLSAEQRSQMPVLVFEYDGRRGWLLRNLGNGPALNVLVAEKNVQGPKRGEWFGPVRVPPMGRGAEYVLDWLGHEGESGLGATYDDFVGPEEGGYSYTTLCGNDLSRVREGREFSFPEQEITAHWKVHGG